MRRSQRSDDEIAAADRCDGPGPPWPDWLWAFGAVLVLSDAFDAALYAAFGRWTTLLPGLPVTRVLLLVVCAAAAWLIARDRGAALAHARAAWFVWPPVGLALLSAAWSSNPAATILWAAALFATTAFGVGLAARFSAAAQARLTAVVVAAVALPSAWTALVLPDVGVERARWQGIFVDKNLLGRITGLGAAAAAVVLLARRRAIVGLGGVVLCTAVLVPTQSRAATLAAAAAVAMMLVVLAARRWRAHGDAILAGGGLAVALGLGSLSATSAGLMLLSRTETMASRTEIWSAMSDHILAAPWLGHGYGAFWSSPAGEQVRVALRLRLSHGHNGAIDLAAELGVLGLVVVLVPLAAVAVACLRHGVASADPGCLWPVVLVTFFVVINAAESPLLRHKLGWALYVAVACHVCAAASPSGSSCPRLAGEGREGGRANC